MWRTCASTVRSGGVVTVVIAAHRGLHLSTAGRFRPTLAAAPAPRRCIVDPGTEASRASAVMSGQHGCSASGLRCLQRSPVKIELCCSSADEKGQTINMLDHLSGATRLFPIIGDPIRYVKAPQGLTRRLAERDDNAACVPMQVPADDLEAVMAGLTATLNVDGILVTMPHKFAAFGYCATSSVRARTLGVVSVIRRNPDGTWHGDMLDGLAFVNAMKDRGARPHGARALLVGAGGAGSAIAVALLEAGVRELIVHDADEGRVAVLLEVLSGLGQGRARSGGPDPTGCDLVCNATPLGLEPGDPLPVEAALLTSAMFVGDVIAGHGQTPFIQAAKAADCQTANGEDMVEAGQGVITDFMHEVLRTQR
jgi:shikimate dehydrogenase